jgi:hypothetical protein
MPSFPELLEKLVTAITAFRIWRDWGLKKVLRPNATGQRKKRKVGSEKAGSLFADCPGVVALRLPNLGLCGGDDLGSDHPARHYQLDASILLTAFRGTI